jgi:hypothetical protein
VDGQIPADGALPLVPGPEEGRQQQAVAQAEEVLALWQHGPADGMGCGVHGRQAVEQVIAAGRPLVH